MNHQIRLEQLVGPAALKRLQDSHVTVCGLGAVGSFALEALVRSGVGHVRIIDFDRVDETNINRQILALHSTVGEKKTDLAVRRIRDINKACTVDVRDVFIDEQRLPELLKDPVDAIIDAIDGVSSKVHLLAQAYERGIYTVSCMGAAGRTRTDGIQVVDLKKTHTCPLARMVRRRLHRVGIDSGIRCVFSPHPAQMTAPDCETVPEAVGATDRGRRRSPLGSLVAVTGIFGLMAAGDVISYLMESPSVGS